MGYFHVKAIKPNYGDYAMKTFDLRKTLAAALVLAFGAGAQTVWNGEVDTAWFDERATLPKPYTIDKAEQLAGLAYLVNHPTVAPNKRDMKKDTIRLGANIALNYIDEWEDWGPMRGDLKRWSAIGYDSLRAFRGTFDGAGFVISGVYIDTAAPYQGLFGVVDGGKIKNVRVAASYIYGDDYVGGIAGKIVNRGTIESSFATGDVNGNNIVGGLAGFHSGTMDRCYATGTVVGKDSVGGLIGLSAGIVKSSYAAGDVAGNDNVGGLAGYTEKDSIKDSYATGKVSGAKRVGGLVGNSNGYAIVNSYAAGDVSGVGGGLIGPLVGSSSATIKNSYAAGAVSGAGSNITGLAGLAIDAVIVYGYYNKDVFDEGEDNIRYGIPKTAEDMRKQEFVDLLNAAAYALSANKWVYSPGKPPTLSAEAATESDFNACFAGGDAKENNPLIITTRRHLENLSAHVNCGGGSKIIGKHFKLGKSIELSGEDWTAIGQRPENGEDTSTLFTGTFDGGWNEIRGVTVNKTEELDADKYQGLFGRIGAKGVVKNLKLIDVNINGYYHVGGLAGWNAGTITGCSVTGKVSGTGGVSGGGEVGGLVGKNEKGTIANGSADVKVTGSANMVGGLVGWNFNNGKIEYSYAAGNVEGNGEDLGGLVGRNDSSAVGNSYATGNVIGDSSGTNNAVGGLVGINYQATITNCYAAIGRVTGNSSVGGLVGLNIGALGTVSKITSSYYNSDIFETANSYGTPKTTDEMKRQNTYEEGGWKFNESNKSTWGIDDTNDGYPHIEAAKPVITLQPADRTAQKGDTLTLTVMANGGVSYQWYSNANADNAAGTPIAGATSAAYRVPTIALEAGTYYYYVIVINSTSAGVTSKIATVKINPVSTLSHDRVIPVAGSDKETALISPVSAITAKLTAGPTPVASSGGPVNFYRQGKRIYNCELQVYDASGNLLNNIKIEDKNGNPPSAALPQEKRLVGSWNLKDANGRPVPSGTYLIKGTVAGTDGKKEKAAILVGVR
jgi:hypothetical protein